MPKKGQTLKGADERRKAVAREYCSNGFVQHKAIQKVFKCNKESAKQRVGAVFGHAVTQAEISRLLAKAAEKADFGPEKAVKLLVMYAESGFTLAKFKKKDEDGQLYWDFTEATDDELALINQLEVSSYMEGRGDDAVLVKKWKIGHSDPLVALDKLMRVYGMYNDKLSVEGEINLIDRINAGRRRVGADDEED